MLCENIKAIRKSKGLSQEELAIKLNVVRQTISKWEQGLSVPDADMLISLSEAFETPVSTLLGEPVTAAKADDLKAVSEKLEIINLQLAQGKELRRKTARCLLIGLCTPPPPPPPPPYTPIDTLSLHDALPICGIITIRKPPLLESLFTHLNGCLSGLRRCS